MPHNDAPRDGEGTVLRGRIEALKRYLADNEPPFPIQHRALFEAMRDIEASRPAGADITPQRITAAAERLRDVFPSGYPRSDIAERKIWQYVAKIIWVPRRISPQDISALLENGLTSRQISALAQWVAAQCLIVRRDSGIAALEACRDRQGQGLAHALIDFAGQPSDLTPEQFAREHAAAIGTWYPWIDYEEDGFDWSAHFDEDRQSRMTFRVTAGDRDLTKILTAMEDEIFGVGGVLDVSDGLAKSGRDLCALVTSVANGCGYCTASYVKGFVDGGGSPRHALDVVSGQAEAYFEGATRILVSAVRTLNDTPTRFSAETVLTLRHAGFSDQGVVDLIHATAYFNYANRVLIALGGYRGGA